MHEYTPPSCFLNVLVRFSRNIDLPCLLRRRRCTTVFITSQSWVLLRVRCRGRIAHTKGEGFWRSRDIRCNDRYSSAVAYDAHAHSCCFAAVTCHFDVIRPAFFLLIHAPQTRHFFGVYGCTVHYIFRTRRVVAFFSTIEPTTMTYGGRQLTLLRFCLGA